MDTTNATGNTTWLNKDVNKAIMKRIEWLSLNDCRKEQTIA